MKRSLALIVVVGLLGTLLAVVLSPRAWHALPQGSETFGEISETLFGPQLLAFEVLSVLLLAALIGAVYLARRDRS